MLKRSRSTEDVKPTFLAVQTPSNEIQQDNLDQNGQLKYTGLQNKGATCYMNSVLQSLFMTPEFRKKLYKWKFNEEEYDAENCIPFQLQKLFSKMQTKFSPYIDTNELIKSFQWDQHQAFEQHDVQEFIRILFDAIENSLTGSEDQDFIKQMYQGRSQNYIKCSECKNESVREEIFNDIIITVKNIFDKIYNESLEKGFQRYLKPEILENDNAYFCETCNKKVKATKGCKFVEFPQILTVILNRFTFDFFTMQRIKLNDFVNFPFILNLNNYINGYDGIKNKLKEENVDPKYFDNTVIIKPTSEDIQNQKNQNKKFTKPTQKSALNKKTTVKARTQNTSDFIKNMRKQNQGKNVQNDIMILETKPNPNSNEPPQLIINTIQKNQNTNVVNQVKQEENKIEIETKENNNQINVNKKQNDEQIMQKQAQKSDEASIVNQDQIIQEKQNIQQNQENEKDKIEIECNKNNNKEGDNMQKSEENNDKTQTEEQKQKDLKQMQEKYQQELINALNKHEDENQKLINQYKQEGDLVYELYSILVHTGGAYGGHYYVLIKSFEDNKWYNFNDTRVSQFDVREISKETYGGNPKNAYMLFYRKIGENKTEIINQQLSDDLIPEKIKEILKKEKVKMEEQQILQKQKSELITVRVFFQVDVKLITLSKKNTLKDLQEMAEKEFKFSGIKPQNIRIRNYKPSADTMLETYTGKENEKLENLKIGHFKNVCLEVKQDDQVFEDFDNSTLLLRLCQWNDNIQSLDEAQLQFDKIKCKQDITFGELFKQIQQHTQINEDQLVISQKHLSHGFNVAEAISLQQNQNTTLEDLNIFDNHILYIEKQEEKDQELKWVKEFETEQHRLSIKFNSPFIVKDQEQTHSRTEFPNTVTIDSRLTVTDLKQKICQQINIDPEELIMRRGGCQGQEIKEGKPTSLKGQHFVSGSSIYLEFGKPAKEGEYRLIVSYATQNDLQNDQNFHEFQEIGEIPIHGSLTAPQAALILCQKISDTLKIELDPQLVRLREKASNRLTKVYRNRSLKEQQLIDKKTIAVEKIGYEQNLSLKQHLVYVRVWNQQEWKLSDRFEIIIQKSDSGFELAKAIYEQDQSINIDNMEATRINAIWNFNIYDLLSCEWNKVNNPDIMLGSQPFHLMNDGYLLIIKDNKQVPRELTEDEIQKMGVIVAKHSKNTKKGYKSFQYKEKSLQITVKKKQQSSSNQSDNIKQNQNNQKNENCKND